MLSTRMCRLLFLAVAVASIGPAGVGIARNAEPESRSHAFNVDIVAVDLAGRQTNLTRNPAFDASPVVARDGRIAFVSARGGDRDLYVMNGNGRNVRRLTNSASDGSGVAGGTTRFTSPRRRGRREATRSHSTDSTGRVGPTACVSARTGAFSSSSRTAVG
jgi:hypothetical protein